MSAMQELQELMLMVKATKADEGAPELTPEQLGRILDLQELGKIVFKAASKTAFGLLSNGKTVPGVKLVNSRTNREWKKGAEKSIKRKFGKRAMVPAKLKSPAQIDEMPGGKDVSARWAFKPEGGTTIASEKDPRRRINRDTKSLFTKKGKK
jgi:hypothetical protein